MAAELRDIRSAAIDGRMHNAFFQKEQLKNLHDVLSKNITEIQDQIARDHRYTQAEASVEYWLALRCIAEAYKSIDPKQHLQAEYAIAKSKDASDAREPVGIVIVEPAQHTFFHSLISALVPAFVHGNCIIVQTEKTLLESPKFILSLIESALDDHVFKVVYSQLTDDEIASRHTRIVQKQDINPRVIAIIERDADLQLAAKAVASARFSLRGKSPFAPDLVLVNEWVKKDFLSALVQHTSAFISDIAPKDPVQKLSKSRFHDTILKENLGEVVFSTSEGYILNIKNRQSPIIQSRSEECYLAIHSVTSMDDAIDLSRSLGRLGASYIFSSPQAAKYISQFIDSQLAFVNHIPPQLLYEPMIPFEVSYQPGPQTRYSPSLFSLPKPQYINDTDVNRRLRDIIFKPTAKALQELDKEATKELPEQLRPAKMAYVGFFEQGFITGAVLMLSGVILGLATLSYHGHNYLRSRSL